MKFIEMAQNVTNWNSTKKDNETESFKDLLKIVHISIDAFGEMSIKFSKEMTILPLKDYNSTWIQLKIDMHGLNGG